MDDVERARAGDDSDGSTAPRRLSARETIDEAAHRLGGVAGLVNWAGQEGTDNESVFWKTLFPRLLTLQQAEQAGFSPEAEAWFGCTPDS